MRVINKMEKSHFEDEDEYQLQIAPVKDFSRILRFVS